ncbi:uracil phosphoribosyltransferase [Vallitalea okinawensis]|uniref:uracil phosphoribosyltransferase n=1 Tax=Vallitalea okinawensis TaxID=2078660 RepID=UPI000CFD9D18|nr:uracil phosphoribosyltransferase [Vallitalea okinawensis]
MSIVTKLEHPLLQHKLTLLRNKETNSKDFRDLTKEIAMLMAYEVTREFPLEDIEIETPICKTLSKKISGKTVAIVPILRAGLGMVDGVLEIVPAAKVGHIGLYRNEETLQPVEYYLKLPKDIDKRTVIITEPMLATGGSIVAAVDLLKARGVKDIKVMSLVVAEPGAKTVEEAHPDIEIFTVGHDAELNEHGYITPGLGDAGDRLFGTK